MPRAAPPQVYQPPVLVVQQQFLGQRRVGFAQLRLREVDERVLVMQDAGAAVEGLDQLRIRSDRRLVGLRRLLFSISIFFLSKSTWHCYDMHVDASGPCSVDPRGCRWAGTKTPRYEEFFDLLPVGKSSM